jgi:hypothetical protein
VHWRWYVPGTPPNGKKNIFIFIFYFLEKVSWDNYRLGVGLRFIIQGLGKIYVGLYRQIEARCWGKEKLMI